MENTNTPTPEPQKGKHYFRDSLQTINENGGRQWIFPKRPKGRLYNYRWLVAILLLGFLFIAPFVSYNGEPFILLNVLERKFIIFGQVFWPQDFHLLVLSIIALIIFIILFTVNFGRVFCGWACPQTIFMEFVFRQIEYLIEGDFNKQKKLDKQDWDLEKTLKKSLKHIAFFIFAFLITNIFLAYLIGGNRLGEVISSGPLANSGLFLAVIVFSLSFYGIYAFFREQVCIIVCPYGRLQGVLLDEKSVVVAYDYKRGEPRAAVKHQENKPEISTGDCIDCLSCVAVCPTGIDIRNGIQLECINCTACIDACNQVMDRIKRTKGLVRYDSEKGISTGSKKFLNARSIAYSAFLIVLLTVISTLFIIRGDVEATVLRIPGSLYQEYGPGNYSNIYKIQLVNKANADMPISLSLISHKGEIKFIGNELTAQKGKVTEANFIVVISQELLTASNTPIQIGIFSDTKQIDVYKTNFLAPESLDK
jgi:cytochrome c oxidase accessory protein FixG